MRSVPHRWLAASLSCALLACSPAPVEPPPRLAGRDCKAVEELYRLPEAELDLGWAACLLDRELDPGLDASAHSATLDLWADELRQRLRADDDLERAATAWIQVVGLGGARRPALVYDVDAARLADVLERGLGNCVGFSLAYLAVAQRAGLEAFGVPQPYHLAVRLESPQGRVDVETTDNSYMINASREDAWFFTVRDRDSGQFGTSWGPRELLAFYTLELSLPLREHDPERAFELAQLAGEVLPEFHLTHQRLSLAQLALEQLDAALESARRALELRPDDADGWALLSELLMEAGRLPEAQTAISRALSLDPQFPLHWFLQARLHERAGADDEAAAAIERALAIHEIQLHPVRRAHLQNIRTRHPFLEAPGFLLLARAHGERAMTHLERDDLNGVAAANREKLAQQLALSIAQALTDEEVRGRTLYEHASASMAVSPSLLADAHLAALSARAAQLYPARN